MSKYDNDRPVAHFRLLCVLHSYMDCIVFFQIQEPVLLLGKSRFDGVDIRIRVKGGGRVAQVYGEDSMFG